MTDDPHHDDDDLFGFDEPEGPGGSDDEDRGGGAATGSVHLQRAAKELISAGRAFLDVVEEIVDDPDAVSEVVGTLGSLGERMARAAMSAAPIPGRPTERGSGRGRSAGRSDADAEPPEGDDDGDDGKIRRIPIS